VPGTRRSFARIWTRIDLGVLALGLTAHKFARHLVYFACFPRAALQTVTDLYYDRHSFYVEDEHNDRGLFDWEAAVVDRHFGDVHRVLVTSCGGGREVCALAETGREVVGTESHPDLCRAAQARCAAHPGSAVYCLAPTDAPPGSDAFDAVVLGWGGYSHLTPSAARVDFLRTLRARLRPDGVLLASFLGRRAGGDRAVSAALSLANPLRCLFFHDPLEAGDGVSVGFCHRFRPGEAADEARAAGFRIVEEAVSAPGIVRDRYPYLVARNAE